MGKKKKVKEAAKRRRELEKLMERARSEYCEVRESAIHGTGVYAAKEVASGQRVIEYLGEKIDKKESERRAAKQMKRAERSGDAAVYIFTLSKKWDIDGSMPWNTARLLNQSCAPNCEAWIEGKRIYLYAMRDIEPGEELTFDYGFDIENFEDHPCQCGSDQCVGYIVSKDRWPELREKLKEQNGNAPANGGAEGSEPGADRDGSPEAAGTRED